MICFLTFIFVSSGILCAVSLIVSNPPQCGRCASLLAAVSIASTAGNAEALPTLFPSHAWQTRCWAAATPHHTHRAHPANTRKHQHTRVRKYRGTVSLSFFLSLLMFKHHFAAKICGFCGFARNTTAIRSKIVSKRKEKISIRSFSFSKCYRVERDKLNVGRCFIEHLYKKSLQLLG